MPIFKHKQYSVDMKDDGAIRVMPNDWVSKYCACIHRRDVSAQDTPAMKREFGRKIGGKLKSFESQGDINRIAVGETIYHIPTHQKSKTPLPGSYDHPIIIDAIGVARKELLLTRLVDLLFMVLQRSPSPVAPFEPSSSSLEHHLNARLKPGTYFAPRDDRQSVWLWTKAPSGTRLAIPASPRAHQQFRELNGKSWDAFRRENCVQLRWCLPDDFYT